jgi:hypothetical protein
MPNPTHHSELSSAPHRLASVRPTPAHPRHSRARTLPRVATKPSPLDRNWPRHRALSVSSISASSSTGARSQSDHLWTVGQPITECHAPRSSAHSRPTSDLMSIFGTLIYSHFPHDSCSYEARSRRETQKTLDPDETAAINLKGRLATHHGLDIVSLCERPGCNVRGLCAHSMGRAERPCAWPSLESLGAATGQRCRRSRRPLVVRPLVVAVSSHWLVKRSTTGADMELCIGLRSRRRQSRTVPPGFAEDGLQ